MAKKSHKAKVGKKQFSKKITSAVLVLDAISLALTFVLCFIAVSKDFLGELPYLVTMITALQLVTSFVLTNYLKKSTKENTKGGIVYDMAMEQKESESGNENE